MEKLKNILTMVNSIALVILFLTLWMNRGSMQNNYLPIVYKNTVNTVVYDSTKKTPSAISKPVPTGTVAVPEPFAVLIPIDTFEIVQIWNAVHTYSQTFQDSSIRISIFDTIRRNKIIGRRITHQWLKPVSSSSSSTVTVVPEPSRKLFLGGFADGNKTSFGAGPKIGFETKKSVLVEYDFDPFSKRHRVSLMKNIKW